jgi:tripartite-type tricarboxylate transporter receptor subunit TctC
LGPISAVVATPLVNSSKLKAYALIGKKDFAGLPQLKTMGELGYPKADIDFWHMLLAPAGTPRPIIEKLNHALRVALTDAKLRKTYSDGGMDLYPQDEESPEAARALLKREVKLWGDVIRANHIRGLNPLRIFFSAHGHRGAGRLETPAPKRMRELPLKRAEAAGLNDVL